MGRKRGKSGRSLEIEFFMKRRDHSKAYLEKEDFLDLVSLGCLVSVDLIVRNESGEVLLGMRMNEPAKGSWFVPGGKIFKNEKIEEALERVLERELGLGHRVEEMRFLGVYQHFYETNFAEEEGLSTHYVVLAHVVDLPEGEELRIDDQHEELKWFSLDEMEGAPEVHEYTRAYVSALRA